MSDSDSEASYNSGSNEVMKIFASDDDLDTNFSGFSPQGECSKNESRTAEKTRDERSEQSDKRGAEKTTGKGPGLNKKGKAPMKRGNVDQNNNENAPKKRAKRQKTVDAVTDVMKSMFTELSNNICAALTARSESRNARVDCDQTTEENLPSTSRQGMSIDHDNDTVTSVNFFSDDDDILLDDDEDFDFEIPKIFEDDEKFGSEALASIASMIEKICKNKSDVSALIKSEDNKIPSNCKGLAPPSVNAEIWQYLDRRSRQQDLMSQNVQRLIGLGIVPLIRMAESLKNKNVNIKTLRDLVTRAMTILTNAMFEASIRRRVMLKPVIDRKFHQLINRNEPVGTNLFGDDVSKRLRDINEATKLNRSMAPKNFRGLSNHRYNGRYTRPYTPSRGGNYLNLGSARTRPFNRGIPKNCRQQQAQYQKKF